MLFRQIRRRMSLLMIIAAIGLFIIAAIRGMRLESSPMLILIVAAAPLLLSPSWIVAGYGIITRRRGLAIAGILLVAAQLFWARADFALPGAGAGGGSAALRVATSNVFADNDAVAVLFESLAARDADLVLLQEMTPEQLERVSLAASYSDYPHRVLDPLPGAHGSVILSKYPIVDGGVIWPGGWPMTAATVQRPDGTQVRVINVHVIAPLASENIEIWNEQLADLSTMIQASDLPVIVAGDFNATAQHSGVGAISALGLRDAHLDGGSGWGGTYPAGSLIPSVLRLDRVLTSDGIVATDLQRLDPLGSDHRPLLATLTFG